MPRCGTARPGWRAACAASASSAATRWRSGSATASTGCWPSSVPLFHVTGCNSQLLVALYVGGTAVIMPVFEVGAFLHAIEAERIDTMVTVPAIYWLAINQPAFADVDISHARSVSYGGAPIAP